MIELLYNEDIFRRVIEEEMVSADHSVWIATANLRNIIVPQTGGRVLRFTDFIAQKVLKEKVRIRLLHASVPTKGFRDGLKEYKALGLTPNFIMKRCSRVHFKAVLVDHKRLYIGSANLTGAGIGAQSPRRRNFEAGFITDQEKMLDSFTEFFENIWNGEICGNCSLRTEDCPAPLEQPEF